MKNQTTIIVSFLFIVFLTINLSSADLCYQETANAQNDNDGNCELNYTGNYGGNTVGWNNNGRSWWHIFDGDWGSFGDAGDWLRIDTFYVNYSKPGGVLGISLWKIKALGLPGNLTINETCFLAYSNTLVLRVIMNRGSVTADCYNGLDWVNLQNVNIGASDFFFYEEGMLWNVLNNLSVRCNNDLECNDNDALTKDSCVSAGTIDAYCSYSNIQPPQITWCYQETANAQNDNDGNCELNYTGNYSQGGSFIDGNWDTYDECQGCSAYINYIKPLNSIGAKWQVKRYLQEPTKMSIPSDCWLAYDDFLSLKIEFSGNPSTFQCYNGTRFRGLDSHPGWAFPQVYEEAIYWEINKSQDPKNDTNSSLLITLTSWPESGGQVYYNYGENGNFEEGGFEYSITNSSTIDTCLLLFDNLTVASSRDDNNLNNFSKWNDDKYTFNFTEKNYTWKVYCNTTGGIYNFSIDRTFNAWDYIKIAPDIYLNWPNNNQIYNSNAEIYFYFYYDNNSAIRNCSQFIDNKLVYLWNDITNTWTEVADSSTDIGKHTWSYSCTNIYGRTGYSENRTFYRLNNNPVPEELQIMYSTTDTGFSNISGFIITNNDVNAMIEFIDNINWGLVNLTGLVKISNGRIFIDSAKAEWLNKNATLTFYSLTFINPRILKDGIIASISFSYANGTMIFNVTGFSEYVVEETPATPPGVNSGSGGGGGGGGGSPVPKNITLVQNKTIVANTSITQKSPPQNTTEVINEGSRSLITGAVIGGEVGKKLIIYAVIFILIIVVAFFGVRFWKSRKEPSDWDYYGNRNNKI